MSIDDLKSASELALQEQKGGDWLVCDEYLIREEMVVARYAPPPLIWYSGQDSGPAPPPYSGEEDDCWREYEPLKEAPDLFIRLASLHEESNFEKASLAFSRRYGVLGGNSSRAGGRPDRTSLADFRREAKGAWLILKMYEASLNLDEEVASRLYREYCNEFLGVDLPSSELEGGVSDNALVVFGMVPILVSDVVAKLCRPGVSLAEGVFSKPEPDPAWIKSAWYFDNLLGAAYLQMYWLLTSTGELTRCEHCGRLISLARPQPEGRKRRRDKRFCNDACRQAHHRSKNKA